MVGLEKIPSNQDLKVILRNGAHVRATPSLGVLVFIFQTVKIVILERLRHVVSRTDP